MVRVEGGVAEGQAAPLVVAAVRQELSGFLHQRDEAMRALQQRLQADASRVTLPIDADASAAGGAAAAGGEGSGQPAASGGGGGAAEVLRLEAEVAALKEARRLREEAIAEKATATAALRAAQQQLEAARAAAPSEAGAESSAPEDEGKRNPEFGRRAPPLPTRQGTMDPAVHPSPAVGAKNPPAGILTDNLGQVTPMGAFSPAADATASQRAGSAGRRRSRLAEAAADSQDAPAPADP